MKVKCPQCNMEYEVEESMRGQKFNCLNENCSGIIGVPKPFSSQNNRAGRQSTADRYNRAGKQSTADKYNTASTLPSTLLWDMHDCFSLQKKCIWGILISMVLFIVFLFALESAEDEVRHCEYKLSYAQMDVRMATNDVIFAYDRDEKDEAQSKLRQAETYLDTCKREFDSAEDIYDFVLIIFWISLVLCVISIIVFSILILKFFYKAWKLLPEDRAITTPNKAIWLNFVPGLFPFWQWVTYFELGKAYSDLTGRRANKVFALIVSVMNFLGVGLLLLLPWVIIMMVFQGELLRSAEIIVSNQTEDK